MRNVDARLVRYFKDAEGQFISGEELSNSLGISRSAVWKHIQDLRELGYELESVPHLGYRYHSSPDLLLRDEIAYYLKSRWLGRSLAVFGSLDSTNRALFDQVKQGVSEGHVIVAEHQSHGRGRQGRTWKSPDKQGLYFSALFKPHFQIHEVPKITLAAAVAVVQVLKRDYRITARIKWPNDILVRRKKVCGILTEMVAETDQIHAVILGIGLNVHSSRKVLPAGASSLKEETGKDYNRSLLLARLLESLEYHYERMSKEDHTLIADWNKFSAIRGKGIRVKTINEVIEGKAVGLNRQGALCVKVPGKGVRHILSGDVILCRP